MANYATLISAIQAVIAANGNNEITGPILQQTLVAMINALGAGYQYIGVADADTTPGTPDQRVFYLAGPGVYPNFGPATIAGNQIGVFKYASSWTVELLQFPIADGSVTTSKLADNAVTLEKLSTAVRNLLNELTLQDTQFDFAISDNIGFTIVGFQNGHIKTKYFDSSLVPTRTEMNASHPVNVENLGLADFAISDPNGLTIVGFERGHIRTKFFDSSRTIQSTLKGKRVAFLGDSITAGANASPTTKRFSTLFCSLADCVEINLGVSGTCIANNTANGLSSQRFITRATQQNIGSADLIFVFGGTNDFSYDSKAIGPHFEEQTITGGTYIGTKKKVAPTDTDTFAGALHELILQIQSVAPNAKVVFIQPLNRGRYQSGRPTSYEINSKGNYLQDFRNAINEISAFYSIPVVPMDVLLNQNWADDGSGSFKTYDSDGIHPNNLGHEAIAKLLFSWTVNNVIFI